MAVKGRGCCKETHQPDNPSSASLSCPSSRGEARGKVNGQRREVEIRVGGVTRDRKVRFGKGMQARKRKGREEGKDAEREGSVQVDKDLRGEEK